MIRAALIALALLAAAPVRAQAPLAIRAGDQGAMSRLVLDLPPGTQWVMEQDGRQVILRFPAIALDFDTSAIFPQRKASRVLTARARAEATGTVLLLNLACDCAAEAFTLGPRKLVVDLRDSPPATRVARQDPPPPRPGKATPAAPAAPAATEAGPEAAPAPGTSETAPPAPERAEAAPPAPQTAEAAPAVPPAPPMPAATAPAPQPDGPTAAEPASDPAVAAEIARARALLLERLAKAAEEGLVDLRPPPLPDPAGDPAVRQAPPSDPPPDPDPGIAVRTAREDAMRRTEPRAADPACLPDAALDVGSWGADGPVAPQIAAARAALVGEFDRIDPAALTRLVKLYIHFTFGREAEALIADLGIEIPGGALLADLARVVEARRPARDSRLLAAWPCPGRAALWGMLARLDIQTAAPPPDFTPPDVMAIFQALVELPAGLRRLVGPRLARGYLAMGRPDLAEGVLLRVKALPGDPGDDVRLAEGLLLDAQGRHEEAEALWRGLIARDRPNAAEAMVALTESRIARGLAPPPGLAGDLSARAYERRRSAEGERLTLAEIEARAAEGDLPTALALIGQEIADNPAREEEMRFTAARLLARADPAKVGPARYAAAVLGHAGLLAPDATADPARLVVADALIGLGLPNAAIEILRPALERAAEPIRQTAARAFVALGETQRALALLEGIEGPDAALLRAEALARAGDHGAALAALPPDAPADLRARLAFAAGDWAQATGLADPVDRVLAAYMAGADPADLPGLVAQASEAEAAPLRAFLAPPRLEEPISLGLARDAVEIARATRELLKSRLAPPGG